MPELHLARPHRCEHPITRIEYLSVIVNPLGLACSAACGAVFAAVLALPEIADTVRRTTPVALWPSRNHNGHCWSGFAAMIAALSKPTRSAGSWGWWAMQRCCKDWAKGFAAAGKETFPPAPSYGVSQLGIWTRATGMNYVLRSQAAAERATMCHSFFDKWNNITAPNMVPMGKASSIRNAIKNEKFLAHGRYALNPRAAEKCAAPGKTGKSDTISPPMERNFGQELATRKTRKIA
jgi:hypothetical protein